MHFQTAQTWWDSLSELYKKDKREYHKFMAKQMEKLYNTKSIRPKFGCCIVANADKVCIKTKFSEHKEKFCKYYIYIYHTKKIKESILPANVLENIEKINFKNVFISLSKVKGDSDEHLYAEAIVHSNVYKYMDDPRFNHKIITRIIEIANKHERALSTDVVIDDKEFHSVEIFNEPKTYHYLNPECVDYSNEDKEEEEEEEEEEVDSEEEKKTHYYLVPKTNIKKPKKWEITQEENEYEREIKLYHSSPGDLKDITSVHTLKRRNEDDIKIHVPRQVQSYSYKIFDRFLYIFLAFNNVTYDDIEILKKGSNLRIYVSNALDEAMSLNFKEKLSDNVKAYFNEKMIKLTISIELLY